MVVSYSVDAATLHDRHAMIHIGISNPWALKFLLIARLLGEAVRLYWSHKSVASWLVVRVGGLYLGYSAPLKGFVWGFCLLFDRRKKT